LKKKIFGNFFQKKVFLANLIIARDLNFFSNFVEDLFVELRPQLAKGIIFEATFVTNFLGKFQVKFGEDF
jgi:hypothetical protein